VSLLTELDAFFADHRLCGELNAGVGARWSGSLATAARLRPVGWTRAMPAPLELDARGRQLRAAFAAVLVPHKGVGAARRAVPPLLPPALRVRRRLLLEGVNPHKILKP
jgi:hypothetical protein